MYDFKLDEYQQARFARWLEEVVSQDVPDASMAGRFTYAFCPTPTNVIVTVTDNLTNKRVDLTDYANL